MYDVPFNELFENERDAVVSYLSLERRYKELKERFEAEMMFCKENHKK